jgi:hypothetical protein
VEVQLHMLVLTSARDRGWWSASRPGGPKNRPARAARSREPARTRSLGPRTGQHAQPGPENRPARTARPREPASTRSPGPISPATVGNLIPAQIWRLVTIMYCYNIKINFLNIMHRPSLLKKHDVSDTGVCLRHHAEITTVNVAQ